MIKNLVTVILPVFNCAEYVSKAIESILTQTYSNLELIILNDGSTDNSEQVIKSFTDERIKYISSVQNTKKIGIVNDALGLVNGEFLAFQDADDWSHPERLVKQVEALLSNEELIICFTGYDLSGSKNEKKKYRIEDALLKNEFHQLGFLNPGDYFPTVCATMMLRTSILPKENGYHPWFAGRVGEDLHWVYRILKYGKGFTIPQSLYYYRYKRPGSFTYQLENSADSLLLYSVKVLSKIIQLDIENNIDILSAPEIDKTKLELDACKECLVEASNKVVLTTNLYKNSNSYRVGNFLLYPFKWLQSKFK